MTKAEEQAIDRAKTRYGEGYEYTIQMGVTPNLRDLREGQYVCAGGKDFHILMTPKTDATK